MSHYDAISQVRTIEASLAEQVQDLKAQQVVMEQRLLEAIANSSSEPSPARKTRAT